MTESLDPTLRVAMLPRDTNSHGTIFGGVILSHIDLAGGIAASRQASRKFVTRAMREVEFIAPVYVGDVVSFYTSVIRQGTTWSRLESASKPNAARSPDIASK
jgi:acyl-CoA thioesterase YciA